ncbi:hypothetical protein EKO27_g7197 [Xylaria grammica]|uniref:RRM domain-containing protein n=1 Tax=Xylaria grammica TaxID=363999 RepID=A0A439D0D7_9PEZI|nr:hypothetical protein EKO27_g7197 [Xylaria grammica]
MAPKYQLYSGFTISDALEKAGEPKDSAQFQAGEPPVQFFTHPPLGCAAVFSTVLGTRPFRLVPNPTYERQGHYWWAAEIQRVCDELRRNLPDACKSIEPPETYWDLYRYFDAWDIYYRGAQNLWNVINTFVFENEYAQEVVEKEKTMQAEQHTPLFEFLAAESLTKTGMQTKLLMWDEEKQPDILRFLPAYELRIFFEGYEYYPEHFLQVIRGIFRRHYESLRNGFSLAHCVDDVGDQGISIPERLAALHRHFDEAIDDPFMDKFEIPNRIVNGIVIADGTSATAARKAGYQRIVSSTNGSTRQDVVQDNGANGKPRATEFPRENAVSHTKQDTTNGTTPRPPMAARCSSAPGLCGKPEGILRDPVTDGAHVHSGDEHEVDKKLMECEEPANPNSPSAEPQNAPAVVQSAVLAANGDLQRTPSTMNQPMPPTQHHHSLGSAGHGPYSSNRRPALPSPSTSAPGPPPSSQLPGSRDHGMSSGAFANQIPPYALPPPHMQGPPPAMQPAYYTGPVHVPSNGGGYTINRPPPYFQTGPRPLYNAPPAPTDGFGSFREQRRNFTAVNPSNGKWQRAGSDDMHGPKVIFRKGSVHGQEGHNQRPGRWQGRESNEAGRRNSAANMSGGHERFNNTRPQLYNEHADPRQNPATTRSRSQAPARSGYSQSEHGCVNAGRRINLFTKFDPCSCSMCSDKDRTIFVSHLKYGINRNDSVLGLLKQYFSKFGQVDDVTPVPTNDSAVNIRFSSPQGAVAAVETESRVRIDSIDSLVFVQFRTGSQFFIPLPSRNDFNQGRPTRNLPPEQRVAVSQPPNTSPSNFNVNPKLFQHHPTLPQESVATSGATVPTDHSPTINPNGVAERHMDELDRGAAQSGFGHKEVGEPVMGFGSPNITLQARQGLAPVDVKGLYGTENRQFLHKAQFGGASPHETSQDLARNIANLTHEITTSRRASLHDTPSDKVQPSSNAPQTPATPSKGQGDAAELPKNRDSAKLDEDAGLDYGTVRVRPGKAQYMPIPPDWRRNIASPLPMSENTHTGFHTKRKASEKDRDDEISERSSPKKKVTKVVEPGNPAQENRRSQPSVHQHTELGTSQAKPGKKKKKNKKKGPQLDVPEDASTSVPYQTQTFQPAIATSGLPQYPQQLTYEVGPGAAVFRLHESIYGQTPIAYRHPRPNENEPFPPYRDILSGSQFPLRGHQSYAAGLGPNRSISSNASTVIQDSSRRFHSLNPGAQNFIPSPIKIRHRNSTLELGPTTPTRTQPVSSGRTDDTKGDTTPKATGKENSGGRMNTGAGRGGGKGKSKNGKTWKHNWKRTYSPPMTDGELQGQPNPKAEASRPSGSRNTTSFQARDEQKNEALKLGAPEDPNTKPPRLTETQPKKPDGLTDAKVGRQDKGKAKEVNAVQELEAAPATEDQFQNDKQADLERRGSRADSGCTKAAHTTKSTLASSATPSSATTTTSPKSKPGKSKGRAAPRKGAGTQPVAKANTRAENATRKGPGTNKTQPPAPSAHSNPAHPVINTDEFPALPTRPVPALAPIPLHVPNPWQKARSTSAFTAAPKPGSSKDDESESRDKGPPLPSGERKGG